MSRRNLITYFKGKNNAPISDVTRYDTSALAYSNHNLNDITEVLSGGVYYLEITTNNVVNQAKALSVRLNQNTLAVTNGIVTSADDDDWRYCTANAAKSYVRYTGNRASVYGFFQWVTALNSSKGTFYQENLTDIYYKPILLSDGKCFISWKDDNASSENCLITSATTTRYNQTAPAMLNNGEAFIGTKAYLGCLVNNRIYEIDCATTTASFTAITSAANYYRIYYTVAHDDKIYCFTRRALSPLDHYLLVYDTIGASWAYYQLPNNVTTDIDRDDGTMLSVVDNYVFCGKNSGYDYGYVFDVDNSEFKKYYLPNSKTIEIRKFFKGNDGYTYAVGRLSGTGYIWRFQLS